VSVFHFAPQVTFTIQEGGAKREAGKFAKESLQVVEIGSWKSLYSVHLRDKALSGSFFLDRNLMHAEASYVKAQSVIRQLATIDLTTKTLQEQLRSETSTESSIYYTAIERGILFGQENDRFGRMRALVLVQLPDYREIRRTPVLTADAPRNTTDIIVLDDRRTVAYGAGRSIICHRTDDLALIWKYDVEEPLEVRTIAIASDGRLVIAAPVDTTYVADQRRFYVALLDGRDGKLVKQLPINGYDGTAVSPDGSLLAISRRADFDTRRPSVSLYEVESGRQVARLEHDAVPRGRELLLGTVRCQFSTDGKCLVTSGIETKVWEIQ
jgi:hypothetical protein